MVPEIQDLILEPENGTFQLDSLEERMDDQEMYETEMLIK